MTARARSMAGAASLRHNISWTFAGNVVYAACQWAMLVALAKLGSPELVGQFVLGLSVTAPVMMFANLDLRSLLATDAARQYQFGHYLALRLTTVLLALLAIAAIARVGFRPELAPIILLVGVAKACEALSDIIYGLLQQREQLHRLAVSLIARGALALLGLSLGLALTGSLFWGVLAMAAAWLAVLLGYDLRSAALALRAGAPPAGDVALRPRWEPGTLARLAWMALPLGFVMMIVGLNGSIPRYFVEDLLGERALGIFAAISYIQVAGATVVNAMGQATSQRLARHYSAGAAREFWRLLLGLAGAGLLLGAGGVLAALVAGRELLTLIYEPEYAQPRLFALVMAAAGVAYIASFFGYAMTAVRQLRAQVPLFALSATALGLACAWLVPAHGLYGAAVALMVASSIELAGSVALVGAAWRAGRAGP